MKSYHSYHGITWGDAEHDWCAFFDLLEKKRRLRLWCPSASARTAARRYDYALHLLADFAEPDYELNFPDETPQPDTEDGFKDFRFVLDELREKLTDEFNLTGRNFDTYTLEKSAARGRLEKRKEMAFVDEVEACQEALVKIRTRISKLRCFSEASQKDLLDRLAAITDDLPTATVGRVKLLLTNPMLRRAEETVRHKYEDA